ARGPGGAIYGIVTRVVEGQPFGVVAGQVAPVRACLRLRRADGLVGLLGHHRRISVRARVSSDVTRMRAKGRAATPAMTEIVELHDGSRAGVEWRCAVARRGSVCNRAR